jgi:hypothetical protein
MNIIDELFELGSAVIDHERDAAEQARADQRAKDDAEFRRKVDLIADATGTDADTLINSLGLRYTRQFDYPFLLTYLGHTASIRVAPPRGLGNGTSPDEVVFDSDHKAATPRESLAKFITCARTNYLARKDKLVKRLRAAEGLERFSSLQREEPAWHEAEVQRAAIAHLFCFEPTAGAPSWHIELWLSNAAMFDADPLNVLKLIVRQRYETDQKREHLLSCINRRADPGTGHTLDHVDDEYDRYARVPLTRASLDVLWSAAQDAGLPADGAVVRAMSELEDELTNWQHRCDLEQQRVELQQASFRPFRYYEIRYSLLGDSDDGEEREVEWNNFDVLREQPEADGFYHTLGGKVIKPRSIFAVLRHEVATVQDYTAMGWSKRFTQPTDCGDIRVVPDGAELI